MTNNAPGTTLTAAPLSAQVFGASGPENVTLGTTSFIVNFSNSLTSTFDFEIEGSNSNFSSATTVGVAPMSASASTTLNDVVAASFSGCTVQVLTERILVEDCLRTNGLGGVGAPGIDAARITGVTFNEANGLATAGTSIALSGIVRGQSNNTFETLSSASVVTSANGFSTTATGGSTITINNSAAPPFSAIGAGTTASLGTVATTNTATVGTNLVASIDTAAAASGGMEFTITHGVLTDSAVSRLDIDVTGGTVSILPSAFNGSVASVNFATAALIGSFDIQINFDGTTAINAWSAGTIDVTHTAGAVNLSAPPSASASLASLIRGGFTTQINTAQSTAGDGATLFQSLVRVVNNGSVAGTVTLTVRDDTDGSLYGNFTTETIEPNSSIQISMGTIESGLGITPAGQYQIGVSGPISESDSKLYI